MSYDIHGGIVEANTSWMVDAACKMQNPQLWFPDPEPVAGKRPKITTRPGVAEAIAICNTCVVKSQCLEYSLEWEPNGIWGGEDERSREKLRRLYGIELRRPRGWR